MFYKVKEAYKRILYLQNYSSERVSELIRLHGQLVRDKRAFAAKDAAAAKTKAPKCTALATSDCYTPCCATEDTCHCPA
jgi:hypothetical protein